MSEFLQNARDIKSNRIKNKILCTIEQLQDENIKPTKYQIHKKTNIAYVTINKYYDDLLSSIEVV
jgi:predicted transcriptional regulator